MTNFEWLLNEKTDDIKDALTRRKKIKVHDNGCVSLCTLIPVSSCEGCIFNQPHKPCAEAQREWFDKEHYPYSIPLDTPVDTLVAVSMDGEHWVRRYFKCIDTNDTDLSYTVFEGGRTSYTANACCSYRFCKVIDKERS